MQNTKMKSLGIGYETFDNGALIGGEEQGKVETAQLYQLAESIDWVGLEDEIVPILGSRSGPIIRLVCGTIFLMSFYELSSLELVEKWPMAPAFRDFCGGDDVLEGEILFPIPLQMLDILIHKLSGRGYDAMIRALMAASVSDDILCKAITLH